MAGASHRSTSTLRFAGSLSTLAALPLLGFALIGTGRSLAARSD